MKLFGKFLIAALVIAVLLPFTIIKGKDGRPLMSFSDIKAPSISLPEMPEIPEAAKLPDSTMDSSTKDIVYQWRDAKGELHFTSSPPPEGIKYTVKGYDPNTNLIQSVEIKAEEPQQVKAEPETKKLSDIDNPYSPGRVEKLIDDAQKIQKLLDERIKKQEGMLAQ